MPRWARGRGGAGVGRRFRPGLVLQPHAVHEGACLAEAARGKASVLRVVKHDHFPDDRLDLASDGLVAHAEAPEGRGDPRNGRHRQLALIGLADPSFAGELLQDAGALSVRIAPVEREEEVEEEDSCGKENQPRHERSGPGSRLRSKPSGPERGVSAAWPVARRVFREIISRAGRVEDRNRRGRELHARREKQAGTSRRPLRKLNYGSPRPEERGRRPGMRRATKITIGSGAILLAAAAAGAAAYRWKAKGTLVHTASVGQKNLASIVTANGTVQARTKVDLSANIMGQITRLNVKEGEAVHKGDLLLVIDQARYASAVDARRSAFEALEADLARQQEAAAQAKRDLKRAEAQFREEILPAAEYDRIRSQYDQAVAAVRSVEREVSRARADLASTRDELVKTEIRS